MPVHRATLTCPGENERACAFFALAVASLCNFAEQLRRLQKIAKLLDGFNTDGLNILYALFRTFINGKIVALFALTMEEPDWRCLVIWRDWAP